MNWKLLLFAALSVSIYSCKKSSNNNRPIDSPVAIKFVQAVPATGKATPGLSCTTGSYNAYDCKLNYKLTNDKNNIRITFTDITEGPVSSGQSEPAVAYVNFGVLGNGTYQLSFQIKSETYPGILVVSDTDYQMSLSQPSANVSFSNSSLKRLQPNTIWGEAFVSADSNASVANGIIDSLVFFGAVPYQGPVGDYYVFNNASGFSYAPLGGSFLSKQFIYTYTGDFGNITHLVNDYNQNSKIPRASVSIFTYTGVNNQRFSIPQAVYATD